MYDIVLRNGLVVDPGNRVMGELSIGINGGRIACVSDKKLTGKREYDCGGLVVTPGFVDAHAHEDKLPEGCDVLEPVITTRMLHQGITTFVGGQCGTGPVDEAAYEAAYQGQPMNCAMLTGHDALRHKAGALDKYAPVSDEQLAAMCEDLKARLAAGSYGLSLGIRYVPGMDLREMLPLAEIVRSYGGILACHVRDDAEGVFDSMEEFLEVGRRTGARLQVSHIGSMAGYGQMKRALAMIDTAAAQGLDVMVDCYPYEAFCTGIGSATFDGDFMSRYGGDITKIEVCDGEYKGRIPSLEIFDKIRAEHPEYLAVAHVMLPEEVDMALSHPRVVLGSDGTLINGQGHPRAAGAFPRFIHKYVVERGLISLYDAVEKMTWTTASRFGLKKGRLSPGWDADIAVFKLDEIRDRATFEESSLPAAGFRYIWLGGELAIQDDEIVEAGLGQYIARVY